MYRNNLVDVLFEILLFNHKAVIEHGLHGAYYVYFNLDTDTFFMKIKNITNFDDEEAISDLDI